ncbi:hypothetical protein CHS0354_042454 [Potamilus streckersoni]|uniref:ADAMTS cysteine-rich domain-containing protein n=1 Tax=Potamilus streckersoni TaxID=2493646 RepID=A0AAE0VSR7_9BIVA|nr:hypothetical protein CHS0354_042454 [Potamilus streckersoni]
MHEKFQGAFVYEGGSYEGSICTELQCADANLNRLCLKTVPADGTPCGYMKLCKQQRCVHSDFATPVPELLDACANIAIVP